MLWQEMYVGMLVVLLRLYAVAGDVCRNAGSIITTMLWQEMYVGMLVVLLRLYAVAGDVCRNAGSIITTLCCGRRCM